MNLHRKDLTLWWRWIFSISGLFIIMTTLIPYLPPALEDSKLLRFFNLSYEMNAATWWSGMCLATAGLLAYELFDTHAEHRHPAWLILAILLFGLSLDEMGTLHERADGWGIIMLIGAICACILGYALIQLFRNRQTRSTAVNIAVAFGLFGTIAIQERIEQTVALPSWMVGIRAGIEEGTELTAVLLILFVLVRQRQHTLDTADTIVPNLLRCVHWPVLLSAGLILHIIISLANAQYVNVGGVANPVVWYPSVLFLVLASTYFHKIPVAAHEHTRWRILLATFFLLASAGSMYAISPRGSTSLLSIFGESTFFYIWAVGVVAVPVLLAQWAGFRVNTIAQIALLFALLLGFTVLRFLPIYAFQYSLAGVLSYMLTNIFLHTASQHIPPEQVTESPFPSYIKGK